MNTPRSLALLATFILSIAPCRADKEVAVSQLPRAVLKAVETRYPSGHILEAGWIEPVRANGNGIFYDEYAVHRALKRLGREGYLINGDVRNGFRFETTKVRKLPLEELFANLSLEDP